MHSWSPPDPWGPRDEKKLSYIHYEIRREEAKLRMIKLTSVFHHLPSFGPKQFCELAHLGCTCEVGTSESTTNTMNVVEIITPNYDVNA